MDLGLKDKVAIITGGGSGIGRAICEVLAEEGTSVVVFDISLEGAKQTAEKGKSFGRRALALEVDVTKLEEVQQGVKTTLNEFGKIDILVKNAGWSPYSKFVKTVKKDWDFIIDLQYYHVLNCCHSVLPHMIERKYGKIVSVLSRLKMPFPIIFISTVALKFVPQIVANIGLIQKAQTLRGWTSEGRNPIKKIAQLRPLLVPLIRSVIRSVDVISMGSKNRAFGLGPVTSLADFTFETRDKVVCTVVAAITIFLIVGSILWNFGSL